MISVVIPVFNEEENVQLLYVELEEVLTTLNTQYEIIFVDDGSTDNTLRNLLELKKGRDELKIIELRRNFGQSISLTAGFHQSKGDIIISMDGDGQNDPYDIPKFLSALENKIDIVCGWRYKRKDSWFFKNIPSKISNFMNRLFNNIDIHDSGCTFRAYRRDVIEDIILFEGEHRYLPAILNHQGFNITEIKVNHRPRKKGKTKYGFSRLFVGFTDLITLRFLFTYAKRPIRLFSKIGLLFLITALGLGTYLLVEKFAFKQDIGTRPLLLLTILLGFSGFQFLLTGFLAELVVRQNVDKKELYSIRTIYD